MVLSSVADASMPITCRSSRSSRAKPAIMPAWVRTGHGAHDDVIEEDVELGLLLGHLARPVGEAQAAERMIRGAGRDGVRLAARVDDRVEGPLPTVADADVEAGWVEAHVAAHDPR